MSWVQILPLFVTIFFSLQIEETCTFMNISSLKYHLSVIQKHKTVIPCVNFIRGERGYGRWHLMLNLKIYLLVFFAPYLDSSPVVCILDLTRRTKREKRNRRGCEGWWEGGKRNGEVRAPLDLASPAGVFRRNRITSLPREGRNTISPKNACGGGYPWLRFSRFTTLSYYGGTSI